MKVKKVIGFIVCFVFLVFSPSFSPGATGVIPGFFDDFESYSTDDLIDLQIPPIGSGWYVMGAYYEEFYIVSDIVAGGSKALRIKNTMPLEQDSVRARISPSLYVSEGLTAVYEHDVYLDQNSTCTFFIYTGSGKLVAAWSIQFSGTANWKYLTGNPMGYVDSGVPLMRNVWTHVKIELYDDLTYTLKITPMGEDETVVCNKVQWASGAGYGTDLSYMWIYPQPVAGTITYFDNVKMTWFDNLAQGYPPIYKVPTGIVVDGSVGANEWDGVKKVASKPAGSRGNFKTFPAWYQYLKMDTVADVYMGYDANNFYVAHRLTNAVTGLPDPNNDSRFEVLFTWDHLGAANDVSYAFRAYAFHSSAGPNDCSITKYIRDVGVIPHFDPSFDANDFWNSGGQMSYSLNAGVLMVEMKIPFAVMPEFTGPVSGEKVNVQFNTKDDTGRGTTNLIMQDIPWFNPGGDTGFGPAVGIAFPICGDQDHQYPNGDLSKDCRINFADIVVLAAHWLECTDPECN